MKARIIQPLYSTNFSESDELFSRELAALDRCEPGDDLIVMPEYCDAPALAPDREAFYKKSGEYNERLLEKARQTARRCNAVVFVNCLYTDERGAKNTTHVIDRQGRTVGRYFKRHLVRSEVEKRHLDPGPCNSAEAPYTLTLEGVKYAFLTCYDFYFYESYARIAGEKPDVIIGCSHQRTDPPEISGLFARFLAYNTDAYVLRASVSMGTDCPVGGGSLAATPEGEILQNFGNRVGDFTVTFDPHKKFRKPAGFGNPPTSHPDYMELGRRPWQYRTAGPGVSLFDESLSYPRVCAHRGLHTTLPENSLPAFGAAVGLGAEEIELDVWVTRDGVPVSVHDRTLERVSDGEGLVYEKSYEELLALDFGGKTDESLRGLSVVTLEQVLRRFGGHTVMNLHLKTRTRTEETDEKELLGVIALLKKYDVMRHTYVMCGNDRVHLQLRSLCPELCRCMGAGSAPMDIVERAVFAGCKKVQFFKPYVTDEMIRRAKQAGLVCNLFKEDDPAEAVSWLSRGIDTVLTDNYLQVKQRVEKALSCK